MSLKEIKRVHRKGARRRGLRKIENSKMKNYQDKQVEEGGLITREGQQNSIVFKKKNTQNHPLILTALMMMQGNEIQQGVKKISL
jgi:hypothetical protein